MHRRSSDQSLRRSSPSSQPSGISSPASAAHRKPFNASSQTPTGLSEAPRASSKASRLSPTPLGLTPLRFVVNDPSDLSAELISSLKISTTYPWAKAAPQAPAPSVEDAAVDQFFEKYVMYPCNHRSTPGFLEHLPSLVAGEFKLEGRMALRWAVRATAYASISKEQDSVALGDKALECYGHALSALGEALKDPAHAPDDMTLMTIVVLDIFEVSLPISCQREHSNNKSSECLYARICHNWIAHSRNGPNPSPTGSGSNLWNTWMGSIPSFSSSHCKISPGPFPFSNIANDFKTAKTADGFKISHTA
jgi:hypothetical protein